jgi:hypothetical protein
MSDEERNALKEELRKEIMDEMIKKIDVKRDTMPYAMIKCVERLKNPMSDGQFAKSPNAGKYAVDYMIKSPDDSNSNSSKLFKYLESITNGFCIIRIFEKRDGYYLFR